MAARKSVLLIAALLAPSFGAAAGLIDELEADLSEGRLRECARRAGGEDSWHDVSDKNPRAEYTKMCAALWRTDAH